MMGFAQDVQEEVYLGPVTEIAIRKVNEGVDLAEFARARQTFVSLLTAEPGIISDREFEAILDGATFGPPASSVFTGMTQYESLAAFQAAGEKLGQSPESADFFSKFSPAMFTALRPKHAADHYDLAKIASKPGQVLEVAVRDLSKYENFDADDYETKLSDFLAMLSQQPGFVAEYQWVSVLDPNIVVGMTVYDSAEAFQALAMNQDLLTIMMPFGQQYFPITGYIHYDAHRTLVPGQATNGHIMDMVIRTVPDEALWLDALAGLNDLIKDEPGVIGLSQEFKSISSAAPIDPATGQGVQNVYFGLGQLASKAAYDAMIAKFMTMETMPPALSHYFSTNSTILNVQVQPFRDTEALDIAHMVQEGQVLEIAIRDVFGYESFEL
ncbi:MAG: hypothetical protein R2865_02895 [Deinococcales bacterium]